MRASLLLSVLAVSTLAPLALPLAEAAELCVVGPGDECLYHPRYCFTEPCEQFRCVVGSRDDCILRHDCVREPCEPEHVP